MTNHIIEWRYFISQQVMNGASKQSIDNMKRDEKKFLYYEAMVLAKEVRKIKQATYNYLNKPR